MNSFQNGNKKIILLVSLLVVFGVILGIYYIFNSRQQNSKDAPIQTKPSPVVLPTIVSPQNNTGKNPSYKINAFIPTYAPGKGSGVNLEASLVVDSMNEIKKLYPFLPYETTLKTSSNQEVDIIIPDKTSQINPWTLQINVFGLDYGLVKGDSGYATEKNSFVSVVSSLYKWIEERGADPKKMMIVWGDKELIQNKSQEWLR